MAAMAKVVFLILSLPLKNPGTESSKRFFVEQLYVTVQVMQIGDEIISTFRHLFLTLLSISRVTVFRQFIGGWIADRIPMLSPRHAVTGNHVVTNPALRHPRGTPNACQSKLHHSWQMPHARSASGRCGDPSADLIVFDGDV
jgi:hypothetical protein